MAASAEQLENQEIGRGDLSDAQWSKLKPLLPPQKQKTGRPALTKSEVRSQKSEVVFETKIAVRPRRFVIAFL